MRKFFSFHRRYFRSVLTTGTILLLIAFPHASLTGESEEAEFCAAPTIDADKLNELQAAFRASTPRFQIQSVSVPAYSSRPASARTLYLDFDGDTGRTWGGFTVTDTIPFDRDGNSTNFSSTELSSIAEIFARVSECYSPFDINVTTVDPGSSLTGVREKMVIGGDGAWYGTGSSAAGGVAYVNSFKTAGMGAYMNGYVFPANLGNGGPKYVADAICHEAGHTFGLQHQSTYLLTAKTAEYDPGVIGRAPIMGLSYYQPRSLWWNGTTTSSTTFSNDAVSLATTLSASPDEAPSTLSGAPAITLSGSSFSKTGIIQSVGDIDVYSIVVPANSTLTANLAPYSVNPMLDGALEVLASDGTSLALSAPLLSQSASLSVQLTAGTYYVKVFSEANTAGDIGSYTVSGVLTSLNGTPIATPITTPISTPITTSTATPTASTTPPASSTPTPTATATSSATVAPFPTNPQVQPTPTPVNTATRTPLPTATNPALPTVTNTPRPTSTRVSGQPMPTPRSMPTQFATPLPITDSLEVTAIQPRNNSSVRSSTVKVSVSFSRDVSRVRFFSGNSIKTVRPDQPQSMIQGKVSLVRGSNIIRVIGYDEDAGLAVRKNLRIIRK